MTKISCGVTIQVAPYESIRADIEETYDLEGKNMEELVSDLKITLLEIGVQAAWEAYAEVKGIEDEIPHIDMRKVEVLVD